MILIVSRLSRWMRATANAAMILTCLGIAWEAYRSFIVERQYPVTVISQITAYSHVRAGGTLQLETAVMRLRPCEQIIDEFMIDSRNVRFDLPTVHLPSNLDLGYDVFKRSIAVPKSMAPGHAILSIATRYICHWSHLIWPLQEPLREIPFEVEESSGGQES